MEAISRSSLGFACNPILTTLGFLDHLLREQPSKRMIAIKRSLFAENTKEKVSVGNGIQAWKGIYQSIRAAQVIKLAFSIMNRC